MLERGSASQNTEAGLNKPLMVDKRSSLHITTGCFNDANLVFLCCRLLGPGDFGSIQTNHNALSSTQDPVLRCYVSVAGTNIFS